MARLRKKTKRKNFAQHIKERFDYDVDELEDYVDEQSPDIIEDLINEGNLKSRIMVMDNVKGSEKIKLITSQPTLQAASTCGWTPNGGIVLTDVTISNQRLKIQEEYCNEDLNGTWAQIENAAGANAQDENVPNFADTMIMYYQRRATELDEDLLMNGDTASLDPNLVFYDGYKKLWDNDASLNVSYSLETEITSSNAFAIAQAFVSDIPTIVKRHAAQVGLEVLIGYETAQAIIDNIYATKDYNAFITSTEADGTISFTLPTTNVTFRSLQTLDGTDSMYAVCYNYMFYATDLENDSDGFQFNYNNTDEKLRFGVKWRSGVQYVFPEYFTRLRLTPTS